MDKVGVRYFPPFVYLYLILLVLLDRAHITMVSAGKARRHDGGDRSRAGKNGVVATAVFPIAGKRVFTVLVASVLGTAAYFLVLAAMRLSPVSYVGPVREVSVVIGAWIGIRFMKEAGGSMRVPGSVLIALGIVLIATGG